MTRTSSARSGPTTIPVPTNHFISYGGARKGQSKHYLLTRFRQRQSQGERKSDQQLCRGDLQDLAYDNIIRLYERYDSADIRDMMSPAYSASVRNRKGTAVLLNSRLRLAVKIAAQDQGVSQSDVILRLNRMRKSHGLKPQLTNLIAASDHESPGRPSPQPAPRSTRHPTHVQRRAHLHLHQPKASARPQQVMTRASQTDGTGSSFSKLMASLERTHKAQQAQSIAVNSADDTSSINTIPEKIWDSKRRESTGYDNITDHVNELLFLQRADMLAKYHEYRSVYEAMYDTIASKKSNGEIVSQEAMSRFKRVAKLVEEMKEVCSYCKSA